MNAKSFFVSLRDNASVDFEKYAQKSTSADSVVFITTWHPLETLIIISINDRVLLNIKKSSKVESRF